MEIQNRKNHTCCIVFGVPCTLVKRREEKVREGESASKLGKDKERLPYSFSRFYWQVVVHLGWIDGNPLSLFVHW